MRGVVWIAAAVALAVGTPAAADPIVVSSAVQQLDADGAAPVSGALAGGGWSLGGGGAVERGSMPAVAAASVAHPAAASSAAVSPAAPSTAPAPAHGTASPNVAPPQTWGFVFTGVPTSSTAIQTPITFFGMLPAGTTLNPSLLAQPFTGTLTFLAQSLPASLTSGAGFATGSLGTSQTSPTPEPASLILLGMGLAGTLVRRRWFA